MNSAIRKFDELFSDKTFTLVDIGACGGTHPRWKDFENSLRSVGFEPDKEEFVKLKQSEKEIWINAALSDKKCLRTLHVTRGQTNTSYLLPNKKFLSTLQWSPGPIVDDHDIKKDIEISCLPLDEVLGSENFHPDFLKLDTQGSELDILNGGIKAVENDFILAEIEVEYSQIYENQPLFHEVDSFMRSKGYYLHDLGNFLFMKPRGYAGFGGAKGRIISSDSLYFRDFSNPDWLISQGENKMLAAVAGYTAYGYPDSALALLETISAKGYKLKEAARIEAIIRSGSYSHNSNPLMNSLAKRCKNIWYKYRKTEHCLWDYPLGND